MNDHRHVEMQLIDWLRTRHGVIGRAEAIRLGAPPRLIDAKVRRGDWVIVHRGVYRHAATPPGPWPDLRAA